MEISIFLRLEVEFFVDKQSKPLENLGNCSIKLVVNTRAVRKKYKSLLGFEW